MSSPIVNVYPPTAVSGSNDGSYTLVRAGHITVEGQREAEWEITRPIQFVLDYNGRPITHPDVIAATIFALLNDISWDIRQNVETASDQHVSHHFDMAETALRRRPDGSWLLVTKAWVYTRPRDDREAQIA